MFKTELYRALDQKLMISICVLILCTGIQTLYFSSVPLTTTLDSSHLGNIIIESPNSAPHLYKLFSLFSVISQYFAPDSLLGFFVVQSLLAVFMPVLLYLTVFPVGARSAFIATTFYIVSLSPFFYSTWLMLEQILMFCIIFSAFFFSRIFYGSYKVLSGFWLGVSLYGCTIAKNIGVIIPLVATIAIALVLLTDKKTRSAEFFLAIAVATLSFYLASVATNSYFKSYESETKNYSQVPRFLFCNLYGHATEGRNKVRADISIQSASKIRTSLMYSQSNNPQVFAQFLSRYPNNFSKFVGRSDVLLSAFVENKSGAADTMASTNHQYCWYILQILDSDYGPHVANNILFNVWKDWVFKEGFGLTHYARSFWKFFFDRPSVAYHGDTVGAPSINPWTVTPKMYAQISLSPNSYFLTQVGKKFNIFLAKHNPCNNADFSCFINSINYFIAELQSQAISVNYAWHCECVWSGKFSYKHNRRKIYIPNLWPFNRISVHWLSKFI